MTPPMRNLFLVALGVLLLGGRAACEEETAKEQAPPLSVQQAAEQMLAALDRGDDGALEQLARAHRPDPWLVVDKLCALGKAAAAQRVAVLRGGPDGPALIAFAKAWEAVPGAAKRHARLEDVMASLRARAAGNILARSALLLEDAADLTAIRVRMARGTAFRALGRRDAALESFGEAARRAEQLGWLQGTVDASLQLASVAQSAGRHARAESALRRVLAIEARRLEEDADPSSRRNQAAATVDLGSTFLARGRLTRALEYLEAGLRLATAIPEPILQAAATEQIGRVQERRGLVADARASYERAFDLFIAQGEQARAAAVLGSRANLERSLRDHAASEATLRRALALAQEGGNAVLATHLARGLAAVLELRGEFRQALALHQQTAKVAEAMGDGGLLASCLLSVHLASRRLGRIPEALRAVERSHAVAERAELPGPQAAAHVAAGRLHLELEAFDRAIASFEQALRIASKAAHAAHALHELDALAGLGEANVGRGAFAAGLRQHQRAREQAFTLAVPAAVARAEVHVGECHLLLGHPHEALIALLSALSKRRLLAPDGALPRLLRNLGRAHLEQGDPERALRFAHEAFQLDEANGDPRELLFSIATLARVHLGLSNATAARGLARRGAELSLSMTSRFPTAASARTRAARKSVFGVGLEACRRLGDAETAWFFLASERAEARLESVVDVAALRAVVVPPALRKEQDAARSVELEAWARFVALRRLRQPEPLLAARAALEQTRKRTDTVTEKIRRTSVAAAHLLHPEPAPLTTVKAALKPEEALVLHGLSATRGMALVLTQKTQRLVELTESQRLVAEAGKARTAKAPFMRMDRLAGLRAALVQPLLLRSGITRVFVAPSGALRALPFQLLFEQREVATVPSGTLLTVLRSRSEARGERTLVAGARTGVGDVVLLGRDATLERLRALLGASRWRALHLGCDGLAPEVLARAAWLDPRHPLQADLVVLAGRDGGLGIDARERLAHALLLAGAPRVICALWKVDAEATQALLRKFHELWNAEGDTPPSAAAALQQAQAYLRSQPRWRDPQYWAAWILVGLPD